MALTTEEASNFLDNNLHFPEWKSLLHLKNPLEFLRQYVRRHVVHIYYQNISLGATPVQSRRAPNWPNVKSALLSQNGGMCLSLNYFTYTVFKAIGLKATLIAGHCGSLPEIRRNHCLVAVHLSTEEIFLVDVGMAQPFYEPVPLHKLPYEGIMHGYQYQYRFNEGKQLYERVHLKGNCVWGDFPDGRACSVFVELDLTPLELPDFEDDMNRVYSEPNLSFFHRRLYMSRFLLDDNSSDEDPMSFVLVNGRTIHEGKAQTRNSVEYKSYSDMLPHLLKIFPDLCQEELQSAIKNFEELET